MAFIPVLYYNGCQMSFYETTGGADAKYKAYFHSGSRVTALQYPGYPVNTGSQLQYLAEPA